MGPSVPQRARATGVLRVDVVRGSAGAQNRLFQHFSNQVFSKNLNRSASNFEYQSFQAGYHQQNCQRL
jgi:hypothetical protein